MRVGGAAHVRIIGPTCEVSGPRADHRAHVRFQKSVHGARCCVHMNEGHAVACASKIPRYQAEKSTLEQRDSFTLKAG